MESLLAILGLIATVAIRIPGLLHARSAAQYAKRSLKLQEGAFALQAEDMSRQKEA